MKIKLFFLLSIICNSVFSQISANKQTSILGFIAAKEFSKDIALHNAKLFVIKEIFGISSDIMKFDIDPLAASNSGEITSLSYKCIEKNKEGLVLGFYNDSWNDEGVIYSGYGFKDLSRKKAEELLNKIQKSIDDYWDYMGVDRDVNNITFQYDDMLIIIHRGGSGAVIRVFWKGFDSEWNYSAFNRTQKKFTEKQK